MAGRNSVLYAIVEYIKGVTNIGRELRDYGRVYDLYIPGRQNRETGEGGYEKYPTRGYITRGGLPDTLLGQLDTVLRSCITPLRRAIIVAGLDRRLQDPLSIAERIGVPPSCVVYDLQVLTRLGVTDTTSFSPRSYMLTKESGEVIQPRKYLPPIAFHFMTQEVETGVPTRQIIGMRSEVAGRALVLLSLFVGEDPYKLPLSAPERIASDLENRGAMEHGRLSANTRQWVEGALVPVISALQDPYHLSRLRDEHKRFRYSGEKNVRAYCRRALRRR